MPQFVRKINKAKWEQNDIRNGEAISADAITLCLQTASNTLSVWAIDSEDDLDDAILAMVAAGDYLAAMDFVMLDVEYLSSCGIDHRHMEAETPVDDLRNAHHDLVQLTYPKLGAIANYVVERFKNDEVERYTEGRLKKVLRKAIADDRLKPEDLKPSIRKKLGYPIQECSVCGGSGLCGSCRGTGRA